MFGNRFKLFNLLGFPVLIDLSWFLVAVLIAWSLAVGVFPRQVAGLPARTYWAMGAIGSIGLFACVLLHELGHAVVARRLGVAIRGITLFVFGGVSEMTDEPRNARAEAGIAVVGPAVSLGLALLFYAALRLAPWPVPVAAVLLYLAAVNVALAVFNLLPAFPLDGGRLLRAFLWRARGDLRWATRVASWIGSGFAVALIALGAFQLLAGNVVGAIWWFVLGLFLRFAARRSYQQLVWRQFLAETTVRRLMSPDPTTVPPGITLDRFIEDYLYRYHYKLFPVVRDGELLGCIGTAEVREVPRDRWPDRTVGDLLRPCVDNDTAVGADASAEAALAAMTRTGRSRLLVVDGGRLAGLITLRDLTDYLARRVDLEEDRPEAA